MSRPVLTIAIPTFNRCQLLRQTVEALLPQLGDQAELLVSDNCSPDRTGEYLNSVEGRIVRHRQPSNVGAEGNFFYCLENARGDYVWLLGDDDVPCPNTVEQILEAQKRFEDPPVIYLRAKSCDALLSNHNSSPTIADWQHKSPSDFLKDVGVWVTFMSSIVVRRDCIPFDFTRRHSGTSLTPTALVLAAVGQANGAIVSTQPLINARGGNADGYRAGTVFTKNLCSLLEECRNYGYSSEAIDAAFASSLESVVPHLIASWRLTAGDHTNIFRHTIGRKLLFSRILPAYGARLKGKLRHAVKFLVKPLWNFGKSRFSPNSYDHNCRALDASATKYFRHAVKNLGPNAWVRHPVSLKNPQHVQIGKDFHAGPGLRLEAWDEYAGESFSPCIRIGDHVAVGSNVHIGAIRMIEIGDNVLIGSNVLITDHAHGNNSRADLALHPIDRPLRSKGPVIIEADVWIGEGACILPGVRIGKNAIVGANAVVTSDVPPAGMVGGVPARSIEHFLLR